MEMVYFESDLLDLIKEANRGDWDKKKKHWVSSTDNIICEYASGNCTGQEECRDCLRSHLLLYIEEQEYDFLQRILERIRARDKQSEK